VLKKRIIPVLLLKNKRMVKGKQFADFRDTGHPVYTAKVYNSQKVDELVFLDIDPQEGSFDRLLKILHDVSEECLVPLTVGGGIRSFDEASRLIEGGADKVSLNTILFEKPDLISKVAKHFGTQAVIASIDVKMVDGSYRIFSNSGKLNTGEEPVKFAKRIEDLGAGEIIITSIDAEGMLNGYDLDLVEGLVSSLSIPVIANGGVGKLHHFLEAFSRVPKLSGVAASSIYHFTDQSPIKVRSYLINNYVFVREI
jgi:imidazole glycerol-phosphate synthase subunit HisF